MDPHADCCSCIISIGSFCEYAVAVNAGSPGIIVPEILDVQAFGFPLAILHDRHGDDDSRNRAFDVDRRADH